MKIRTGFVSNSSTSSFIVFTVREPYNYDPKAKKVPVISKEQIRILKKAGFKATTCTWPELYDSSDKRWFEGANNDVLGCDVICNQDDIVYLLVINKIPFAASIHYNNHTYVWDGKSKHIQVLNNWGALCGYSLYRGGLGGYPGYKKHVVAERKFYAGYDRINVAQFIRNEQKLLKEQHESERAGCKVDGAS